MSRTEARRRLIIDDHVAAIAGAECRKDEEVIAESPAAYKPIEAVMEAQCDLTFSDRFSLKFVDVHFVREERSGGRWRVNVVSGK